MRKRGWHLVGNGFEMLFKLKTLRTNGGEFIGNGRGDLNVETESC